LPAESSQLASYLQDELIKSTGVVSRGIKDERFRVIRGNQAPVVLVVIDFISNDKERANLVSDSYQNQLCTELLNGIMRFLSK